MVNLLRPKSDLAGYKGMVGITVSVVIAPRVKDAAEVRSSGDDEVELVPVAGTGVSLHSKKEFVIHRPWMQQSSRSLCPWPRQNGHA